MPQRLIDIDVHDNEMKQLELDLAATPKEFDRALNSTVNRMARWLKTQSVRGLSSELDIPQKILRRRLKHFRVRRNENSPSITVWYGLNDIYFHDLNPRQTATGITAGKRTIKSAFIATMKSGKTSVFNRKGKKRLGIQKQTLGIQKKATQFIDKKLFNAMEFNTVFLKTFERELEWRTKTRK